MANAVNETRAWLDFFSKDGVLSKSAVIEALMNEGVNTYELDLDMPIGPGLLFFD